MGAKKRNALPTGMYIGAILGLFLFPALVYLWPEPFESIDAKIYDFKLSLRRPEAVDPRVVHLDIDDRSVKKYGLWPWDRRLSAEIVNRLQALGAATIVFDIFYPSPGRSPEGDEAFLQAVAKSGRVVSATAVGIAHSAAQDAKVSVEDEDKGHALRVKSWPVEVPPDMRLYWVNDLRDSFVPMVPLIKSSKEVGHIASTPDRDGVHRRIPMLVSFFDRCIPSLSLAALVAHLNADSSSVRIDKDGYISVKHGAQEIVIPVDSEGNMLINWPHKKESFPRESVAGILGVEVDGYLKQLLKDKIVVVAYSATGTTDMGTSPLFTHFLMSRVHSCALNTMLTGRYIKRVFPFPLIVPLAGLVSVLFAAACPLIRHRYAVALEIAICALYMALVIVFFLYMSYDIPTAAPLILFSVSATATLITRAISMESRADRVSNALQRYLSPQMLETIVAEDHEIDLSTKRKELTILFVDIRGFSKISETVETEYLEKFLNDFLEVMTRAVFDNHGTIDKFLGDGLLAFFGDPMELENHALAAIAAAHQMQREMGPLNARWSSVEIEELSKGVHIRVGINTGMVVVGNIGSRRRMEYTVLGSAVNVASRLQEMAPPDGILISSRTHHLARDHITCNQPRNIRVKGVDREITVYEIESVKGGIVVKVASD